MSFISRIEPEPPDREPMAVILEELTDIHTILQILSLRLTRLEGNSADDHSQIRPEGPS